MAAAAAAAGHPLVGLAPSTGRIHADKTLDTYKPMALRYAHWARGRHGVRHLDDLDAGAAWLVDAYLTERLAAGDSPHTLQTTRSALRMLHRPGYPDEVREESVASLGATVAIPKRRREEITRSRGHVAMDDQIDLAKYRPIIAFCQAVGPRRRELEALVVGAIRPDGDGGLVVLIDNGKGGKHRAAPVLPGHEAAVLTPLDGRAADARVFDRVPVRLDIHSYRRDYAQSLYCEEGRRTLPKAEGRLDMRTIDRDRALYVSHALGHGRVDVMLRHYLR